MGSKDWKLIKYLECRIYYRAERLWRKCGGGRGSACMSRKGDYDSVGGKDGLTYEATI